MYKTTFGNWRRHLQVELEQVRSLIPGRVSQVLPMRQDQVRTGPGFVTVDWQDYPISSSHIIMNK